MSVIEWPAALPYQREASGSESRPSRAQPETEMEGGNVRLRQRPGDRLRTEPWSRRFTPSEYAAWGEFLAGPLGYGSRRFLMPVWTGAEDGDGYQLRLVQIVGGAGGVSEVPTGRGMNTRVSFTLLVFPAEMVSLPSILSVGYLIYGSGLNGQTVEVEVDGVIRSGMVSGGVFLIDGADLALGAHAVRARYAGGPFGPMQTYTIAAAAGGHFDALAASLYDVHSPLRVLTAWHGAVIRARRFDSVEKDFFALDVSPWLVDSAGMGIAEWAGIGAAYVAKCYGQKGASHDAVQATGAAQPRIVNAGVLDVGPNGRPQMVFSGAQYLEVQNALGYSRNAGALTLAAVVRGTGAGAQNIVTTSIAGGTSVRATLAYFPNSTTPVLQGRSTDASVLYSVSGALVATGAWIRSIGRMRYAGGGLDIAVNGAVSTAAISPAQATPDTDSQMPPRIGTTPAGTSYLTGGLSCSVLSRASLDVAALDAALAQVMP